MLRCFFGSYDRLTVIAEQVSPGKTPRTVHAVVVITVTAQVNKFIATLLLTEPTLYAYERLRPHDTLL